VLLALGVGVARSWRWRRPSGAALLQMVSANPDYVADLAGWRVPDEWELRRDALRLLRELGRGSFGSVHEAVVVDEHGREAALRSACGDAFAACAVKMVRQRANVFERFVIG